jgi:hypothetical protein
MHIIRTLVVLAPFLIGSASFAVAQPGSGTRGMGQGGGWGPGSPYGRLYNPKTVETVSGEITSVEKITPGRGMSRGVHITLKTDKAELLPVHLGPEWYIDRQTVVLKQGDKVQIRGSRITFQDKPALIAAEVTKGDETLVLRDANGVPAWAGWRGRGR